MDAFISEKAHVFLDVTDAATEDGEDHKIECVGLVACRRGWLALYCTVRGGGGLTPVGLLAWQVLDGVPGVHRAVRSQGGR